MNQEAEKRISFGFLRGVVDNAKDTSFIETIDDENQLRYMQKYIELKKMKRDSLSSIYSLFVGIVAFLTAGVAIGVSFILTGITSFPKFIGNILIFSAVNIIGGILIFSMCIFYLSKIWKHLKEFKENKKDADIWYDIILKIEERIICLRGKYLSKE